MANIRFKNSPTPETPPAGTTYLYVDTTDNHIKTIDENGTILDLSDTSVTAIYEEHRYSDSLGVDIDNIDTQGLFLCDTNLPAPLTNVDGVVEVIESNFDDSITQELRDITGNTSTVLYRTSTDGGLTWGAWIDNTSIVVVNVVGDDTLTDLSDMYLIDASSNDITITLADAVDVSGKRSNFKRIDTTKNKVYLTSTDGIDTETIIGLSSMANAGIFSNGTQYYIL